MNKEKFVIEEGVETTPPAWEQKTTKYGLVDGLPEEELATVEELERMYFRELWRPVLMIPGKKSYSPAWDVLAGTDYNAFATVDFDRMRPEFDKARYVRDKLWEQVKDLMIRMKIVTERIKDVRKYKILRLVGKGILDADDIQDGDLWQVAMMLRRAIRLRKNIARLEEKSRQKKQEMYEKWLESLG